MMYASNLVYYKLESVKDHTVFVQRLHPKSTLVWFNKGESRVRGKAIIEIPAGSNLRVVWTALP